MTQCGDITARLRNPDCGWSGDAWAVGAEIAEEAADEIERLRAVLAQSREAMNQMMIWMPSGFAPQSKDAAYGLTREAIKAIDALNEQEPKR